MNYSTLSFLLGMGMLVSPFAASEAQELKRSQPVTIGKINGASSLAGDPFASNRYLVTGTNPNTIFDLKSGFQRPLSDYEGISLNKDWKWAFDLRNPAHLKLSNARGTTFSYSIPAITADDLRQSLQNSSLRPSIRVSSDYDAVVLISDRYTRWNKTSRRLQRDIKLTFDDGGVRALSRDGETIANAGYRGISMASTRTGHIIKRVPLVGFGAFEWIQISPFGSYAFYDAFRNPRGPEFWRVVDARTGQTKWRFNLPSNRVVGAFSRDEKWIALPFADRKIWEIRKLSNGKIVRTLPLVAGANNGAFSPDGTTLYSVANGIAYRQRAR